MRSAFQLPILTFLLNGLPASGPTDTRVSWPLVYANKKLSCSMTYRWLKNCCVLFVSLFVSLAIPAFLSLFRIVSRHSASEHWKCSGGCGGNFTNDSGGLRGLSFVSLVAEMARSGTQVMLHYPYPLHRRSLRDSSNDKDRLQIDRVIRDHQDQWAKEICNAILEHTG